MRPYFYIDFFGGRKDVMTVMKELETHALEDAVSGMRKRLEKHCGGGEEEVSGRCCTCLQPSLPYCMNRLFFSQGMALVSIVWAKIVANVVSTVRQLRSVAASSYQIQLSNGPDEVKAIMEKAGR
jgi:hypothetical protein